MMNDRIFKNKIKRPLFYYDKNLKKVVKVNYGNNKIKKNTTNRRGS